MNTAVARAEAPFTTLKVLSTSECVEVQKAVHALREHWLPQHPTLPFYTLGTASYLDAAQDKSSYYEKARRYNPVLREQVAWLYQRVAEVLARHLGVEVMYRDTFARPGFHIFLSDKAFERPMASIHRDLQYRLVDWDPEDEADFSQPLSFTLPIVLPALGGGMNVWELHHDEIEGLPQAEVTRLVRSRPRSYFPYEPGKMVLASGHQIHQIAPLREALPGDERITLQGHAVRCRSMWHLYW